MVSDRYCFCHWRDRVGRVTVRVGGVFILMGIAGAVIWRHADAIVFGALLVVCGLLMLRLKGV
jgi:hypothetical protein